MFRIKKNEPIEREFEDDAMKKEYEIEKIKELARADAAIEYENVRKKNRLYFQDNFLYITTWYIVLTCLNIIAVIRK